MITRRECLLAGAASAALTFTNRADSAEAPAFDPASPLPHKGAFFPFEGVYLNSASQHPLSRGARAAVNRYLDYKTFASPGEFSNGRVRQRILANYANLIGAEVDEVCFVPSTTAGENLVLKALDIPYAKSRIVTDELHFIGSLPTYAELAGLGMDVVTLRASPDGSIDIAKFDDAVTAGTRLVSVSLVSSINGFRHDLKSICEIAHSRGALVYADVIHAVGSTPFDVRESGVDFASASSYKWLMGEMGLGFLYVRKDRLDEIRRPWFGHGQLASWHPLGFPNPEPSDRITEYRHLDSALGYFAMGTLANVVAAQLDHSLGYLLETGIPRIQAYRQPLIDRLQDELPKRGYASITPPGTSTALVSFRHGGNPEALAERLAASGITATVAEHHLRISPSVFNDFDDVERLIRALS